MAGVTAIHYSLSDVNAVTDDVHLSVDVHLSRDWAGVDSHTDFEFVARLDHFGDFQSALHRGNEISRED
jgi:hypothetical protein